MGKRNLTVQLDEETIHQARILAAERSTSISALVAAEIHRLVGEAAAYQTSRQRARELMHRYHLGGPPYASRDELHER